MEAVNPDVEQTVTMLPCPRGAIARTAACTTKNTPRTLTAISRSYSSGSTSVERTGECDAGARDDRAQRGLGVHAGDDLAHLCDIGDVELDRARGAAGASQIVRARRGGRDVDVGDDDVVAAAGECPRDRSPDPLGAADDEGAARLLSGCRWHR